MGGASANYTANDKNQYSAYSNPTKQWITGEAATDAQVFVNGAWAWRNGKFFAKAIDLGNQSGPVWKAVTVESKLLPGGGNMPVATGGGHVLAPPRNVSPGYDANDNVTGDGLWNYTWDGENRLVGVETISAVPETGQKKIAYAYDFEGRRIQTTRYTKSGANWVADPTGPTVMLYDGWNLIAERNSTADKKYLWGPDLSGTLGQAGGVGGLLAIHNAGQTDSVAYDANGNVAALVNASSGTLDGSYEYGPFGEPLVVTGPMAEVNPFRFSTKYTDNESGLVYYGYRYYNPETGRWINRDPIQEEGGVNLYGFVKNNPIASFDLLGLAYGQHLTKVEAKSLACALKAWLVGANVINPILSLGGEGYGYTISFLGHYLDKTGTDRWVSTGTLLADPGIQGANKLAISHFKTSGSSLFFVGNVGTGGDLGTALGHINITYLGSSEGFSGSFKDTYDFHDKPAAKIFSKLEQIGSPCCWKGGESISGYWMKDLESFGFARSFPVYGVWPVKP